MSIAFGLYLLLLLALVVAMVVADQIHRRGDCDICRQAGVLIQSRRRRIG